MTILAAQKEKNGKEPCSRGIKELIVIIQTKRKDRRRGANAPIVRRKEIRLIPNKDIMIQKEIINEIE